MQPQDTPESLIEQIAQRDREAFVLLYDQFVDLLYATLMPLLKDPCETEDLLQDVFVKIWERAGQYDPARGKAVSWLIVVTRNAGLDRLRVSKRRRELSIAANGDPTSELPAVLDSSAHVIEKETALLVRKAMDELPLEQKTAIHLAFFQGLSQTEIANSLDQPLGTVKARIRRGMMRLRSVLQEGDPSTGGSAL